MCDKKNNNFIGENCDPKNCSFYKVESNNIRLIALIKEIKAKQTELRNLISEFLIIKKRLEEENRQFEEMEKAADLKLLEKIYESPAAALETVNKIFKERLEIWQDAEKITQSLISCHNKIGREYVLIYEKIQKKKMKCRIFDLEVINDFYEERGSLAEFLINKRQ